MTYVVGDVHGEFDSLTALFSKFKKPCEVYFVGDLVDRGLDSRKVIEFIRQNNFKSVLGNHDLNLIKFARNFAKEGLDIAIRKSINYYHQGLKETLYSYGFSKNNFKFKEQFFNDIAWLSKLKIYEILPMKKGFKLPVVISHACVANYWGDGILKASQENLDENLLLNREIPNKSAKIFNIFGHTPQENAILKENFINLDTGCCYGYKLSAICLETNEILEVETI